MRLIIVMLGAAMLGIAGALICDTVWHGAHGAPRHPWCEETCV